MTIPAPEPSPDLSPEFDPRVITASRRMGWLAATVVTGLVTIGAVALSPAAAAGAAVPFGWCARSYFTAARDDRAEHTKSVTILVSLDLPGDRHVRYDQAVLAVGAEWESLPLALPPRSAVRVTVQKIAAGGPL